MALIIDIETTGLPNRKGLKFGENPSYLDNNKYDSCRIVQISYMLCDNKLEKIKLNDNIIKRSVYNKLIQFMFIINIFKLII